MRRLQHEQEQDPPEGILTGQRGIRPAIPSGINGLFHPFPVIRRGNTALLLFEDHFTGFFIAKDMKATGELEVAKAFEESNFRLFGALILIPHDRDPRFVSAVTQHSPKPRATLSYQPQENAQQELRVNTMIQTVRVYAVDRLQAKWYDIT